MHTFYLSLLAPFCFSHPLEIRLFARASTSNRKQKKKSSSDEKVFPSKGFNLTQLNLRLVEVGAAQHVLRIHRGSHKSIWSQQVEGVSRHRLELSWCDGAFTSFCSNTEEKFQIKVNFRYSGEQSRHVCRPETSGVKSFQWVKPANANCSIHRPWRAACRADGKSWKNFNFSHPRARKSFVSCCVLFVVVVGRGNEKRL